MRRTLKVLLALMLMLLALSVLYVGAAGALMLLPVHAEQRASRTAQPTDVQAFVLTNGVHTDLVFPIRSAQIDWTGIFPMADAAAVPRDAEFIAIGWGDREFYLHTPTWADLTVSRALGALAGRNPSLLHVTWLRRGQFATPGSSGAYALPLTAAQYAGLAAYVRAKLPDGLATPLPSAGYGGQDAFYEATGSYGPFETCNTWTGRGLRNAGLTMGRWTPFDYNVVRHLDAIGR
ncbi:TIGR02117 family protein [Variovorax sp. RHLX14]|uniref:TIGR02117 family protein n=1 Tax=Variovorax sp. RHLX14 TaxID=1259731 RepID=UPI003F45FCFC